MRTGGEGGVRRLDGITDSMDVSLSKLQEMVKDTGQVCCSLWGHKESVATLQLNNNNGFSRTRFL